ncbi:hypothetical protein COCCADRAFT_25445 [Bipolaris zeicola 26-R-13]|uniref:Uncharacterized protein n=1 Tax=Cochliobolus carbonum (strain 26-R-13) TaxID=930089 RepID=W6YG65_COCC2|nr:uncharacterized protein COCCADRAFT_25445 [Bipolaris zeicola 26-R-13]EUC34474.1 hypothetical protein COCCADRAFT_25445 [Bipolaris zeicola 26-R-13]
MYIQYTHMYTHTHTPSQITARSHARRPKDAAAALLRGPVSPTTWPDITQLPVRSASPLLPPCQDPFPRNLCAGQRPFSSLGPRRRGGTLDYSNDPRPHATPPRNIVAHTAKTWPSTVDGATLDARTYAVSVAALLAMQQAPGLSARLEWLKTRRAQSHLGLHHSNHALSSSPLSRLGRSAPYLPHGRSMPDCELGTLPVEIVVFPSLQPGEQTMCRHSTCATPPQGPHAQRLVGLPCETCLLGHTHLHPCPHACPCSPSLSNRPGPFILPDSSCLSLSLSLSAVASRLPLSPSASLGLITDRSQRHHHKPRTPSRMR